MKQEDADEDEEPVLEAPSSHKDEMTVLELLQKESLDCERIIQWWSMDQNVYGDMIKKITTSLDDYQDRYNLTEKAITRFTKKKADIDKRIEEEIVSEARRSSHRNTTHKLRSAIEALNILP